jgi:hypothetical protein
MSQASQFELHLTGAGAEENALLQCLPWSAAAPVPSLPPLAIGEEDGLIWVGADPRSGQLKRQAEQKGAHIGLRVVRRRLGASLAMFALSEEVLVNGLPALPLTVLTTRDSVVLAPGCLCYVTERVRPFIGAPAVDLLGKQCPFCRLPAEAKSRIVTCRCGALYHHETAESHPELAEADRLHCFEKVQSCLSCGRPLSVSEYLVWDPSSL